MSVLLLLLSLAPQPSLGLGLHRIRLNFLEASQQFSFLQGRVVSPTPNPHPGGPDLCIYIPQRQGGPVIPLGTHFSRLLRHAWVTVGLFLFPGHHTGKECQLPHHIYIYIYVCVCVCVCVVCARDRNKWKPKTGIKLGKTLCG
jgi:hypothetical protein